MPATHARIIHVSQQAFKDLTKGVADFKYTPKGREGFIVHESLPHRLSGRYLFKSIQKDKVTNPETLEVEVVEQPVLLSCTFELNARTGVLRTNERRRDMDALEEAFSGIDNVRVELEDFSVDVIEVYKALRAAHSKVDLRSIRIKDYLGKEGLLTTANFKLMEPGNEASILQKYQSQAQAFSAAVMTEDGRQTVTVARNGSIRYSDNFPLDLVEMLLGQLPKHHEAVEGETVEG